MNADAFRHFYDYHLAENRKLWDRYVMPLSHEQFTQHTDYSHGSVRDQIVHLMSVDDIPFTVTHLSWRTVPGNCAFLLCGKRNS